MKKLIALAVVTIMAATMLCACSFGECDLCGDTGFLSEKSVFGIEFNVCSDCGG